MRTIVKLTIDEAIDKLQDCLTTELGTTVNVEIERPTKIRFDKIQAIKALREEISTNPYIESRPTETCTNSMFVSGSTRSGFYIGLAHAKTLIERIMEKALL